MKVFGYPILISIDLYDFAFSLALVLIENISKLVKNILLQAVFSTLFKAGLQKMPSCLPPGQVMFHSHLPDGQGISQAVCKSLSRRH